MKLQIPGNDEIVSEIDFYIFIVSLYVFLSQEIVTN